MNVFKRECRYTPAHLIVGLFIGILFLFLNINKISAVGEIKNVNGYNVETAYEINEVYIENNQIHLKGWYVAKGYQNFAQKNVTHLYSLSITGINKQYNDIGDYNTGGTITNLHKSANAGFCSSQYGQPGINQNGNCNYYYDDVGFHFAIPLQDFQNAVSSGVTDFYFQISVSCLNSRAGYSTISQFVYVTNTRVGNGQGINLDIGNGYTANLYSNLEYKEIIVQPINAYVKTGPGKGYSVSKYGSKSRYWGYQYMYSGLSYAGSSELTDWFGLHFSDYGYQYNRWRVANGGSNYGYIPTSYFNVRNYTSNGENAALHLKILNKSPEITATTTQTYYSGQDLTTDMLKSGIIANDREDGKYILNGAENKLRMEISSKEVTISNDKINTKNLDGSYQFTVKVTDTAGASTTSNLTVKFIKNTAPTISGIKKDEEKIMYIRNYNLKSSDILQNITSDDIQDGDLSSELRVLKGNEVYDNSLDRNIPKIYNDFSVEVKDIPLIDIASHNISYSGMTAMTDTFNVAGGRNYQISVPTTQYKIIEYNSSGTQIRDSGWIQTKSGVFANSYTVQANASKVKIIMNSNKVSDPTSIHMIRDVWAQNVALTTNINFILNIMDYYPPELSGHDFYYFVGYPVNEKEILEDIVITDTRFDVDKIRETLKITNFDIIDPNTPGEYIIQITATNSGIEENPDLAEEKYTGSLNLVVHIIDTDDSQFIKKSIRYINNKHVKTLSKDSNWYKNEVLTNRLKSSLEKNSDDAILSFAFTGKDMQKLKEYINTKKGTTLFTTDFNQTFFEKIMAYSPDGHLNDGWIKIDGYWCYQYFDDKNRANLYTSTWKEIDNALYYFDEAGHLAQNKWVTIDDKLYYFTNDGSVAHGWTYINGNYYYFDDNYEKVTGFKDIDGNTYYFDNNGIRIIGWYTIEGNQYYFGNDGIMRKDQILEIDGITYIFMENGQVPYYLVTYKDKLYCIDPVRGMIKNEIYDYNGNKYLFGDDGSALKGWQIFNNKKYYINSDYQLCINMFAVIDGEKYYFNKDGVIQTENGFITVDGKIYYVQDGGTILRDSWKTINGYEYYFNKEGIAATEIVKINSEYYYFDETGKKQINTWHDSYYFNSNGKAVNGWQDLHDPEDTSQDTFKFYFKDYQAIKNSIFEFSNESYYADVNGHIRSGLMNIGNDIYFFDETNYVMKKNQLVKYYTDSYFFGEDGKAIKNTWKKIDDYNYYFKSDGKMARDANLTINYNNYHFDAEGKMCTDYIDGLWYYNNLGIGEPLLRSYDISGYVIEDDNAADGNIADTGDNRIVVGIFNDGRLKVTGIGDSMFFTNKDNYIAPWLIDTYTDENNQTKNISDLILSVEFSDSISIKNLDYWFINCKNLENVSNLPITVESMISTFDGDTKLFNVTDMSKMVQLTTIKRAFAGTGLILSPILPDNITDMDYAFTNCLNLVEVINIPKNVVTMQGTFENCPSLQTVPNIPSEVENLNYTFQYDSNLKGKLIIETNKKDVTVSGTFTRAATTDLLELYGNGTNNELINKMLPNTRNISNIIAGNEILSNDMKLKINEEAKIKIYHNFINSEFTFTSDKSIVEIDNKGNIKALKSGETIITISHGSKKCTIKAIVE